MEMREAFRDSGFQTGFICGLCCGLFLVFLATNRLCPLVRIRANPNEDRDGVSRRKSLQADNFVWNSRYLRSQIFMILRLADLLPMIVHQKSNWR
jgi:hypothetical protein